MENSMGFFQIGPIKARFQRSGGFKRRHLFLIIPSAIVLAIGLFWGLGHLLAWLWRATVSRIFGVAPISFWQAWGLMLLCQLLFKDNITHNIHHRGRQEAGEAGSQDRSG